LSDPSSTVLIRDAALADRPAIVEFNRCLALETEGKVLDPAVLGLGVDSALANPDRLRYWVAEIGGPSNLVGQAAITREWTDWRNGWLWWLQSVYVAKPFRGRGVFRTIYHHIRQQARSHSDVIGLRLYVEDSNQQAHSTYRALGMTPGGYSVYEELWVERFQGREDVIAGE
jgi:GNAT superfamily N-acetyltransferase